ncbi:MAG: hypothetical protein D6790_10505 [Caldilineae bacterium]|nr:MAG: hypothetical protein D6790_10505 [Caldilineae bacterium]
MSNQLFGRLATRRKSAFAVGYQCPFGPGRPDHVSPSRPWLDETFGDCKGHGFDLEAARLRSFRALSRLILAVVLLYVWTVAFGSQTIKNGLRRLVDRPDRRDLSLFRIGLYMLERCLANDDRIAWRPIPYFT